MQAMLDETHVSGYFLSLSLIDFIPSNIGAEILLGNFFGSLDFTDSMTKSTFSSMQAPSPF